MEWRLNTSSTQWQEASRKHFSSLHLPESKDCFKYIFEMLFYSELKRLKQEKTLLIKYCCEFFWISKGFYGYKQNLKFKVLIKSVCLSYYNCEPSINHYSLYKQEKYNCQSKLRIGTHGKLPENKLRETLRKHRELYRI